MYSYTGKDLTALSSITVPLRVESELHQLSMTSLTCMRTIRYHFMNDWKDHRLMINHTSKVYDGPTYQGWLVHITFGKFLKIVQLMQIVEPRISVEVKHSTNYNEAPLVRGLATVA